MVKALCSPAVISYISTVALSASSGVPPMNLTMAGAPAMAKPPMPPVSVIALSPISRLASAAVKPGNHSPAGMPAWQMYQRSPVPLRRMAKSVPLRAITVTTVQPGMFPAGSSMAFMAAMERFKKK